MMGPESGRRLFQRLPAGLPVVPQSREPEVWPDLMCFEERCRQCGDCGSGLPGTRYRARGGYTANVARGVPALRPVHRAMPGGSAARRGAGIALGTYRRDREGPGLLRGIGRRPLPYRAGNALAAAIRCALLRACRERGIRTALETCGFAPPAAFLEAALLADLVLFDLKLMDAALHKRFTGVSNARILANLEALAARGRAVTVRIPRGPRSQRWRGGDAPVCAMPGRSPDRPRERCPTTASAPRSTSAWAWRTVSKTRRSPRGRNWTGFAGRLAQAGLQVKIGGWR